MLKTLAILWLAATPVHADEPSLYGDWARGDGKAKVRIETCGAEICAVNTWIRPGVPDEKVGDRLVMTIAPAGPERWSGRAFDPQRHLSFRIRIDVGATRMMTHGCVLGGLVCNNMGWTRL